MDPKHLYICSECGLINCRENEKSHSLKATVQSQCVGCGSLQSVPLRSTAGQDACRKHQKLTPDNYYSLRN